jgi:HPt (histidine-containing phosphotransfer) domain-containing protein
VSEIADLISLFLAELDGHLQRVGAHKSDGNFPDLAREAHIVVSTAGNVGALQLSALAGKVETACKEKRTGVVPELVEDLNRAAGSAAAALKDWLERRSPAPRQAA